MDGAGFEPNAAFCKKPGKKPSGAIPLCGMARWTERDLNPRPHPLSAMVCEGCVLAGLNYPPNSLAGSIPCVFQYLYLKRCFGFDDPISSIQRLTFFIPLRNRLSVPLKQT